MLLNRWFPVTNKNQFKVCIPVRSTSLGVFTLLILLFVLFPSSQVASATIKSHHACDAKIHTFCIVCLMGLKVLCQVKEFLLIPISAFCPFVVGYQFSFALVNAENTKPFLHLTDRINTNLYCCTLKQLLETIWVCFILTLTESLYPLCADRDGGGVARGPDFLPWKSQNYKVKSGIFGQTA